MTEGDTRSLDHSCYVPQNLQLRFQCRQLSMYSQIVLASRAGELMAWVARFRV